MRFHRRSIRLKSHCYAAPGVYFITIVTAGRQSVFGKLTASGMKLSEAGEVVGESWARSALIRSEIELDAFTVMPDHIHGIVRVTHRQPPRAQTPFGRPDGRSVMP